MDPFTIKEIATIESGGGEVPTFKNLGDAGKNMDFGHKSGFEDLGKDIPDFRVRSGGSEIKRTDDNGREYRDPDGKLLPNAEYEVNDIAYQTDDHGRINSWKGDLKDTPENERDLDAQKNAGGEDRRKGDHGGHLVARMNGGAGGDENMVAMRGHLNQSDYKRCELEENHMLKDGKQVSETGKLFYDDESARPSKIEKTYSDGEKTVDAVFDNEPGSCDLLDDLKEKSALSKDDLGNLKNEIADMRNDGNEVSVTSVINEYDAEGKLNKTVVGVMNETTHEKEFKTYTC